MRTPLSLTSLVFAICVFTSLESLQAQGFYPPPGASTYEQHAYQQASFTGGGSPSGAYPQLMTSPGGMPLGAMPSGGIPGFNPATGYADFGPGGPGNPMGMGHPMAPPRQAAQNMQAYPGTDMYRWDRQEHFNDDGLWFSKMFQRNRTFYGSIEYLSLSFKRPRRQLLGTGSTAEINAAIDARIISADDEIRPFQPQVASDLFVRANNTPGGKLKWGYRDDDGTGVVLNGWIGTEAITRNHRRAEDPTDFTAPVDGDDEQRVNAYAGGISLRDEFGNLVLVSFDHLYAADWTATAWGTGFNVYHNTIRETNWYKLRPVSGLRYINVGEKLSIYGVDSGDETYEFNRIEDGCDRFPGDLVCGQPTTVSGDLDAPYEALLQSSVRTHLAGPELGLRMDVGGESLNLWLQATAGVMVNNETVQVNGYGMFDRYADVLDDGNAATGPEDGSEFIGQDFAFSDTESHTHISPTFEASVNAEFDLQHWLPFTRRWEKFDTAVLRVNYSYLYMGRMARPFSSIKYDSATAGSPSVLIDYDNLVISQLGFALDWTY